MADNLYLELELFLDPPITNFEDLKKELGGKITEWNKLANADHKYKHMVQIADAFCKRIEQPNPPEPTLKAMGEEACKTRERDGRKAAAEYERDGILEQAAYEDLVKKSSKFFTEKTVASWFNLRPEPPFVPPKKPTYPGVTEVDTLQMKEIARDLGIFLGNEDATLYDLLTLPATASLEKIREEWKKASDVNHKKPKGTAKVDAEQRLLGKVNTIFKNNTSREGYDIARRHQPAKKLADSVFNIRASRGTITHEEYENSITEALQVGLSKEEAEWYVFEYYRKRKCPPPRRRVILPPRQQCPNCYVLNDINAKECTNCKIPFDCPKCGQKGSFVAGKVCKCGFALGDMPIALKRLEEAKQAIAAGNIEDADELLRQAEVYWKNSPGAEALRKSLGELKKKNEEKKVEAVLASAQKALQAKDIETSEKHLFAAKLLNPQLVQISVLEKQLTELKKQIQKEKADLILETVLPAKSLTANVTPAGTVKLTWAAATISKPTGNQKVDISYIVVRKADSIPGSENDGETIVNTQELHFEDTTTKVGQVYGYAVFPSAFGTTKSKGTSSNKIIRTAPVSQLQISPSDGTIRLTWQVPNKAAQIAVIRKKGAIPKDIKDGERISMGSALNGCVDNNLVNNQTYGYLVIPLFKGIQGEELPGVPTTVSGTPRTLPPAPTEVLWQIGEQGFDIQWKVIPNGDFKFYLSESPLGKKGDTVELHDPVFSNVKEITACDYSQGRGNYPTLLTKPFYLTPVSRNKHIALLGEAVLVIPVRNVTNFKIDRNAGDIFLTWDWGTAEEVLLVYRTDGFPVSLDDERAIQIKVTRAMYQDDKAYIMRRVGSDNYYFLVATGADDGKKRLFSTPQQYRSVGSIDRTVLKYEFVTKKTIFGSPVSHLLRISIVNGKSGIPELALFKRVGRQPLRREEGSFVKKIEHNATAAIEIPLPNEIIEKNTYYKLFPFNPGDVEMITINHPASDKMKF